MRIFYKPTVPLWVNIVSPLIHAMELVCLFFAFQVTTGYPGWYGAALGLAVLCLFELTIIPMLLLPLTLLGAHYLTGLPWIMTLPVFLIPYMYNFYYMRRFRRMEAWRKLMQQPTIAARARML